MKITKGKQLAPISILLHGEPGSGKSLFGHKFDTKSLFVGNECPNHYDCDKVNVSTWEDFLITLKEIREGKADNYKTIVIDTLDGMQDIMENDLLVKYRKNMTDTIQTILGGYGKGTSLMASKFRSLITDYFVEIQKTKNIILISHSFEKTLMLKNKDTYNCIAPNLIKGVNQLFERYVDCIFYFERVNESFGEKEGRTYKTKYYIHTTGDASCVAKNRFNLKQVYRYDLDKTIDGIKEDIKNYFKKGFFK